VFWPSRIADTFVLATPDSFGVNQADIRASVIYFGDMANTCGAEVAHCSAFSCDRPAQSIPDLFEATLSISITVFDL
jgi:hypothetical protein